MFARDRNQYLKRKSRQLSVSCLERERSSSDARRTKVFRYGLFLAIAGLVIGSFLVRTNRIYEFHLDYEDFQQLERILAKSEKAWPLGGSLNGPVSRTGPDIEQLNEKLGELGVSAVPVLLSRIRSNNLDKIDEFYAWLEWKILDRERERKSEQRRRRSIYTLCQLTKIRPDLANEITEQILKNLQGRLKDRSSRSTNSIHSEAWAQMWLCWILFETGAEGQTTEALVLLNALVEEKTPSVSRAAKAALRKITPAPSFPLALDHL